MTDKPWAYVAHKDGYWAGIISPDAGKKQISEFMADFAERGFTITTAHNEVEHKAVLDRLRFWRESPEYKASLAKVATTLPLFGDTA